MQYPLHGLRVLDLSRVVSGPYAGRLMSDLGADVVKVEAPQGDDTRWFGEVRHGLAGFYCQVNSGKRNISVDLRRPGAVELIRDMAAVADVVIENFRPGVLASLGLGWDDVRRLNPCVIMLSITGFGQSGPWATRAAYAPVVHAESGLLERQASHDGTAVTDLVLSLGDSLAGLHGTVAVLAALHLRARTGVGQHIDLAMLDAMLASDDYAHYAVDGVPLRRIGGEVWETGGGPLMVGSVFNNTWRRLAAAFSLEDAPQGVDRAERTAHRRTEVGAFLRSLPDRETAIEALESVGLAWADVRSTDEVLATEYVAVRGAVAEVDDRGGGRRGVIQTPYRYSAARSGVRGGAPFRGEHNHEVLHEWLRLDEAEVDRLVEVGVLSAEQPLRDPAER